MTRFRRIADYVVAVLLEVASAMKDGSYYAQAKPWESEARERSDGHPTHAEGI